MVTGAASLSVMLRRKPNRLPQKPPAAMRVLSYIKEKVEFGLKKLREEPPIALL